MEVGIDIEQNKRFENLNQKFLERIYDKRELAYALKCKNSQENLCALWCVKEAVVKAFSNRKLTFNKICVLKTDDGKPFIEKNEMILNELKKANCTEIKISISHSKDYSTAICIIN